MPRRPDSTVTHAQWQSLHANEQVGVEAHIFEAGEDSHEIDCCAVCSETRLVTHATSANSSAVGVPNPVAVKPWEVFADTSERELRAADAMEVDDVERHAKFSRERGDLSDGVHPRSREGSVLIC